MEQLTIRIQLVIVFEAKILASIGHASIMQKNREAT